MKMYFRKLSWVAARPGSAHSAAFHKWGSGVFLSVFFQRRFSNKIGY